MPEEQETNGLNAAGSYLSASFGKGHSDSTPWHTWAPTAAPSTRTSSFGYRIFKRGLDLLFILVASPVWLLILAIVAALVHFTSPGPIFFSHRRLCRGGAFFSMWKYRTMHVNSTEILERHFKKNPQARREWQLTHKLRDDPRVTPLGRLLRRYSLDELPQVWNVVAGTMSLVGPRPIVAAEVEKYADSFRYYTEVKPGITGLWQVSGRSTISYPERVQLDREYVINWSLLRDLWILASTLRSVVNQEGAY